MLRLINLPNAENLEVLSNGAYGQVCKFIYKEESWAMKRALTPDNFRPHFENDLKLRGCCHGNCRKDNKPRISTWSCKEQGLGACFLYTCKTCNSDYGNNPVKPTPDIPFCQVIRRHPLMKEVSILKPLAEKCPSHFPSVLGLLETQNQIHFLFELSDMDLEKYMGQTSSSVDIDNNHKRELTNQLFQGIEFIHRCGFVHNDLKPKNILMKGRQLKITDFGISMRDTVKHSREINTVDHRPPECFLTRNLTFRNGLDVHSPDLWASGLITSYIWTGKYLFTIPKVVECEKLFMLLQIFLFWKHTNPIIFDSKNSDFQKFQDQIRNAILIPDGYCCHVFGDKKFEVVDQNHYFDSVDNVDCKPFFDKYVKQSFNGRTYEDLYKFMKQFSKHADPVAMNYLKKAKMFDDIITFIVPGEKVRNIEHIKSIGLSEDFITFSVEMKKTIDLLIERTRGNEIILTIVKRLLSMDRCRPCRASQVLSMLQVNKLLEEYVPTECEFESHYQTSLLQLHYQV